MDIGAEGTPTDSDMVMTGAGGSVAATPMGRAADAAAPAGWSPLAAVTPLSLGLGGGTATAAHKNVSNDASVRRCDRVAACDA
jgi:lipid-binding SYLF domain-containing protein